jgi:hypothetical protein
MWLMKERPGQNWETCKFGVGNLAFPDKRDKLTRLIFPKKDWEEDLEQRGINQFYFCSSSELIKLKLYRLDRMFNKGGGFKNVAKLYSLDLSENSEGVSGLALYEEDLAQMSGVIKHGLKMCGHCKFYKPKEIKK